MKELKEENNPIRELRSGDMFRDLETDGIGIVLNNQFRLRGSEIGVFAIKIDGFGYWPESPEQYEIIEKITLVRE